MLEFYLFDSEKKQVQLSDFSQLFISMKIVWKLYVYVSDQVKWILLQWTPQLLLPKLT
jgi:hypothetical protein